jgi:tetratricopeptide (TPR) repeat protein
MGQSPDMGSASRPGYAAGVASCDNQQNARRAGGITRTVNAGFAHHQAGRVERAEALYRKALAKDPDHAEALHLLGVIAYQRGQIAAAIELIDRALPELHDLPEAHLNLGNALRAAGRLVEAADSYQRAIALEPDYGMAHSNLARALNDRGIFEAALESARRAIALIPDFLGAQLNCAAALQGLERFAEVEAPLRRALELQPDDAKLHSDLGGVLTELDRFDEAVACHQRAIALNPNDAMVHYALGWTQYWAQDLERSETSLRQALSIRPEFAHAWQFLGSVISTHGRFEEASACYRRALEIDPDLPGAHQYLAMMGQRARDEAQLERLRALLASPDRSTSDRIVAGFALGALLDNADRYDEAFPYFAAANTLVRQQRAEVGERYDPDALQREVDRLITVFTPTLFSAVAGWGNPSQVPVFIVGMPRSGTSLVEQIAASHSRVFGAGELEDVSRIAATIHAAERDLPADQLDPDLVRRLADGYVAHLQSLGAGAARVIDKMPDNIFHLGLIAVLFPAARIILCQRDARDTCLSCYFHLFADRGVFTYDLADCGRQFLEVDRLATHWLGELPIEMLVIDYEALVADLEGESRRLIEFLGLDWEPACLDFHKTERPVFTGSYWQVRQPLYTHSVERWRNYERHLGPLFEALAQGGAAA